VTFSLVDVVAISGTPAAVAIGAMARETPLVTVPMMPMTLSWLMSF